MVFWASCRPWPSAMAAAETVCASRKPRLTLRVAPSEDPQDGQHHQEREREADDRRDHHRDDDLVDDAVQCTVAAGGERRADQAADQGVGRGRRQAEVPGDQVPGDRADQAGEHDDQAVRCRVGGVDDVADRLGDLLRRGTRRRSSSPRPSPARRAGVSARVETEVAMAFAASWKPLV